jgi:hypothetical protein
MLSAWEHLAPPTKPVRSVLCVRGGPLAIDELAHRFHPPTPAALLIANACFSAHVDLRDLATGVSVLSGSTGSIKAENTTPLSGRLAAVLASALDCDKDGQASDFEIFSPLERGFDRTLPLQPNPKLRRQVFGVPAFFHSGSAQCPETPRPLDAPAVEYFFAGRRHVRFDGRVAPELSVSVGGLPDHAFAVPCSERVGQCYDVAASVER